MDGSSGMKGGPRWNRICFTLLICWKAYTLGQLRVQWRFPRGTLHHTEGWNNQTVFGTPKIAILGGNTLFGQPHMWGRSGHPMYQSCSKLKVLKEIFFFLKDRFGNRWSRFALMVVIFVRPAFWHLFLGCPMGGLAESDFGGGVCDARSHWNAVEQSANRLRPSHHVA